MRTFNSNGEEVYTTYAQADFVYNELEREKAVSKFVYDLKKSINGENSLPASLNISYRAKKIEEGEDLIPGSIPGGFSPGTVYKPTGEMEDRVTTLTSDQLRQLTDLAIKQNNIAAFSMLFEQSKSAYTPFELQRMSKKLEHTGFKPIIDVAVIDLQKENLLMQLKDLDREIRALKTHYAGKKDGLFTGSIFTKKYNEADSMIKEIANLRSAINNSSASSAQWTFNPDNPALKDGEKLMAGAKKLNALQSQVKGLVPAVAPAARHS